MIQELKDKYSINSVSIVSMNDYINISQVPFPAITLMSDALMIHEEYRVETNEELSMKFVIFCRVMFRITIGLMALSESVSGDVFLGYPGYPPILPNSLLFIIKNQHLWLFDIS